MNKTTTLHLHLTFVYSHYTTTTWNDRILRLLGNGKGEAINSTISVRTRAWSLLFSSKLNSLLYMTGPLGKIVRKSKRMRSLFFSDVFMDVAVVGVTEMIKGSIFGFEIFHYGISLGIGKFGKYKYILTF